MNVAILGFDTEGRSTLAYLQAAGHTVTILDQNEALEIPSGVAAELGETYLSNLDRFDLTFRTAGLNPDKIFAANPGLSASKVTSQLNEFMRVTPTVNIIAVTGTKGKGTTSSLIYEILKADGKEVVIGGNIGVPVLDLLPQLHAQSWVVLEVSSFQLSDFSPANTFPAAAVCLMVVPEHLNWHKDLYDYVAAKARLFALSEPGAVAVHHPTNELTQRVVAQWPGKKVAYNTAAGAHVVDGSAIVIEGCTICTVDELRLLGRHNWDNVCAAITAVWQFTQNVDAIRTVVTSFSGLEHRLSFVRELDGVRYYDDSFGTTPETAIVALQAFEEPKVIILGGSDKGASYDELAQTVAASNVRKALLIGDQAERIKEALDQAGFANYTPGGTTMTEIVANTRSYAAEGDVVLLSTGCASFGMFKDYKDRGNQFIKAVQALG